MCPTRNILLLSVTSIERSVKKEKKSGWYNVEYNYNRIRFFLMKSQISYASPKVDIRSVDDSV